MKKRQCCPPTKEPGNEPLRSTVCFINTSKSYITNAEYITLQKMWNKFEQVENHDAEVYNRLINTLPKPTMERPWYQFSGDEERQLYLSGQINHILEFPLVSSFQTSYSNKKLEYVSSVLEQLSTLNANPSTEVLPSSVCYCDVAKIPQKPSEQILKDRIGLNLYVRVSTQNFLYPKSPYRFINNQEYLTYKSYEMVFGKK